LDWFIVSPKSCPISNLAVVASPEGTNITDKVILDGLTFKDSELSFENKALEETIFSIYLEAQTEGGTKTYKEISVTLEIEEEAPNT